MFARAVCRTVNGDDQREHSKYSMLGEGCQLPPVSLVVTPGVFGELESDFLKNLFSTVKNIDST
jgi:hypothetical protein